MKICIKLAFTAQWKANLDLMWRVTAVAVYLICKVSKLKTTRNNRLFVIINVIF